MLGSGSHANTVNKQYNRENQTGWVLLCSISLFLVNNYNKLHVDSLEVSSHNMQVSAALYTCSIL